MSFLRGIDEKILQRSQQERTKPPAVAIGLLQPIMLKYCDKKILGEVLSVLNRIAACADKRENGPPISPAKLGQRPARLLLFAVGRGKDHAPASGYELTRSISALLANVPVHERTLWFSAFYKQ